jgi:hypothetical protein
MLVNWVTHSFRQGVLVLVLVVSLQLYDLWQVGMLTMRWFFSVVIQPVDPGMLYWNTRMAFAPEFAVPQLDLQEAHDWSKWFPFSPMGVNGTPFASYSLPSRVKNPVPVL